MPETLVADAGPLIALARIEGLAWLPALFKRVLVTESVLSECLAEPEREEHTAIRQALAEAWLQRVAHQPVPRFHEGLGVGESETLQCAIDRGCRVLVDDRLARRVAQQLGLPVVGTLGALIAAKRCGLLEHIQPSLERLHASGYFLSDAVRAEALRLAGENP
ncbi:MAG: DUF3368 domain-containing protein [Aquimonas sp.]|nr:DUF3368 domain-containing protein [Aquimonas sp.]